MRLRKGFREGQRALLEDVGEPRAFGAVEGFMRPLWAKNYAKSAKKVIDVRNVDD
jgi:hypothetical protein